MIACVDEWKQNKTEHVIVFDAVNLRWRFKIEKMFSKIRKIKGLITKKII